MNDMDFQSVVDRQEVIANGEFPDLGLPKHDRYAICNLRGGIGKTTLSFNLCFLADDVLAVDTCPQGNLSFFFINRYKGIKPKNQVKSRTEPPTLKAAQT